MNLLPEYEIAFLSEAVPELKDYLLSDVLFWPLGGRSPAGEPFPRLTLGAMLFSSAVLASYAARQDPGEAAATLITEIESLRSRWRTAWEQKAAHELSARLRQWQNYVEEYGRSPRDNAANYANDIRTRVYIQLLTKETGALPAGERQILTGLDTRLRRLFQPGAFILEPAQQAAFPQTPHWYLYGSLKI